MAFKLMRELVFKWPVKVMEPDPDAPGQYVEKTFTAVMAIIDPEKVKASNEKRLQILSENAIEKDYAKLRKLQARLAKHDEDAMREVLRGWEDLLDETDKPLPFNAETFRMVHGIDRVRIALQAAYAEAISQDRARLGN